MYETPLRNTPLPFDQLAKAIKGRRSIYGQISGLRLDRAAPGEAWSSLPYRPVFVGDTGTGDKPQYAIGRTLAEYYQRAKFTFTIMVGDNIYGSERPQDFQKKFEMPYKPLLDAGVPFYAALGNHDDPNQRFDKFFNMNGERFYTFKKQSVRFFALDSNYMDRDQVAWLESELKASGSDWKIAYFHHPLYSSGGTHGSEVDLRTLIEPLFLQYGVNVVFAGHEHFYERIKPQKACPQITHPEQAKRGCIHEITHQKSLKIFVLVRVISWIVPVRWKTVRMVGDGIRRYRARFCISFRAV